MAGRVMLNPWIYGRSGRNPVDALLRKIKQTRTVGEFEKVERAAYRLPGLSLARHAQIRAAAQRQYDKLVPRVRRNPRRSHRNLPLTVYVGRKRHTRSALIKKFGALKGHRYWRRAKTKYHGYGAFGARCKTRRKRLNPRPWQATRRGRRYGLVYGMGSVPVREQKRLLRSYHGLKSVLAPEAMRYGSPRFRKSRNRR